MVKLGEVCEILDSKRIPITASERVAGEYPYYGANGIQGYINDYIFDDELVLLAEDGGNFGSKDKPIAYRVSGKCWVNNHAHVLKPKNGINVDYLCYSLMYYDVSKLVNGATRQKLTQSDMRKIEISLVGEGEQGLIVKKLNRIYELVEKRKQQLQKLDELVKARFVEMFGDFINNQALPMVELKNIAYIGSSKRIYASEYSESGIPFYRSKEIRELGLGEKPSTELYITEERYVEIKKKFGIPKLGDILIAAIGATIGYSWVVDTEEPFYYKDGNIINISVKSEVNCVFLNYVLQVLIADYKTKSAAGSAQLALTIEKLEKMKVIYPEMSLQNQFSDFVQQINKSKLDIQKSLDKLETLKKALMQKYFG